jgi:DNA-binding response OmpR family regulator
LGNSKKKILIIDDEAHIRYVIALKLKNRGYEVMMAMNGEEGLGLIMSEKPDVVISDIIMPKMDGKTLCERTDSLKKERPFLTIIMTCRISPHEQAWIDQMQDTLFMEKPFSPALLVAQITNYFSRTD